MTKTTTNNTFEKALEIDRPPSVAKLFLPNAEALADKHDKAFILWFDDILIDDVALVGGKNASLGEMYQKLTSKGDAAPHGFAITSSAYKHLIKTAGRALCRMKRGRGLDDIYSYPYFDIPSTVNAIYDECYLLGGSLFHLQEDIKEKVLSLPSDVPSLSPILLMCVNGCLHMLIMEYLRNRDPPVISILISIFFNSFFKVNCQWIKS